MTDAHEIARGLVFRSGGIGMYTDYLLDDRGDPTVEKWAFSTNDEDSPCEGYGCLQITVREIVQTERSGALAVYHRQWIAPDGEPISSGRRVVSGLAALKALITRRAMTPFRAILEGQK